MRRPVGASLWVIGAAHVPAGPIAGVACVQLIRDHAVRPTICSIVEMLLH
jgi:hypothetical protein